MKRYVFTLVVEIDVVDEEAQRKAEIAMALYRTAGNGVLIHNKNIPDFRVTSQELKEVQEDSKQQRPLAEDLNADVVKGGFIDR